MYLLSQKRVKKPTQNSIKNLLYAESQIQVKYANVFEQHKENLNILNILDPVVKTA